MGEAPKSGGGQSEGGESGAALPTRAWLGALAAQRAVAARARE
jgi:hypothetical protein